MKEIHVYLFVEYEKKTFMRSQQEQFIETFFYLATLIASFRSQSIII